MLVVSNTSPILNLAIIGKLNLLKEQFEIINIPTAVKNELRIDENLPGCSDMRIAIQQGWIKVAEAYDKEKIKLLNRTLDLGESEAITLSLQLKADLILMDEKDPRKICRSLNTKVTGVLGILMMADKGGKLFSFRDTIDELINAAGFRIKADLYDKLLDQSKKD